MAKLRFDHRATLAVIAWTAVFLIACSSDSETTPTPPAASEPGVITAIPDFGGGPPTWPQLYSGNATAAGQPVPAGFTVIARVGSYESQPIITLDGRYLALTVAPFDEELWGGAITFYLLAPGGAEVQAEETETFQQRNQPSVDNTFPLKFPRLP